VKEKLYQTGKMKKKSAAWRNGRPIEEKGDSQRKTALRMEKTHGCDQVIESAKGEGNIGW